MISSRWPLPIGTYIQVKFGLLDLYNINLSVLETRWSSLIRGNCLSVEGGTYEGVDSLEASLHGLVHGLSWDNAGGLQLDSLVHVGHDGSLSVDSVTEGVDDTAEETLTDRDIDNGTGSLDDITFLDLSIVTKDDDTDVVSLEVKSHTLDAGLELNHLSSLDLGQTENTGDTITDGDDGSELLKVVLYESSG